MTPHEKHAKKAGIWHDFCSAWTSAIGGGCLCCGFNLPKRTPQNKTKEEKIAYLKSLGFEFDS